MVKNYVLRLKHFLEIDLWKVKISTLPKTKGLLFFQLRVWIISFQEFKKDNITEKASALTYFTLLSIVPVIAMAFGISKGFGLEIVLKRELERYFAGNEMVLEQTLEWSSKMLDQANGGIISGISFVFLMYAVLRLLYNIEMSFNSVWGTKSRSWQRKISDYIAIILLGPLFIILSSSATVFVTSQVQNLASEVSVLSYIKPAILLGLKIVPFSLIWILMFLLYIIFPNTKVKLKPAIVAGILAGTLFQLTQWGWINGQVYLSRYSTIYGAFAALPLFMIYLQLSWLIVLFGAEYAFAMQNANTWEHKNISESLSGIHKKKMCLLILRHIIKNFELGNPPMTISQISGIVHVPYRFVSKILKELEAAGIVNKVASEEYDMYIPALDINRIDVHLVLRKLDYKGFDELKTNEDEIFESVENAVLEVDDSIKLSKVNKLLKDV